MRDELKHYGIPGQKKGVRRWQNVDGSFNEEGKIRYGRVGLGKIRKLKDLSDDEFARKYKNTNNLFVAGVLAANGYDVYNTIRGRDISIGFMLTSAALLALDGVYMKELARRTGTKLFTFNNDQLKTKEKYLRKHGGMTRVQEHLYDKRMNKKRK